MRFIRDPIHQNIILTDLDVKLLDTKPMQRLRGVKQTGMVYLVYPGATHTRFEHSIGTRFVAEEILKTLKLHGFEISKDDESLIYAASLLHDVGHTAFSHALNPLAGSEEEHENIAYVVIRKSEVSDVLTSYGIDPKEVARTISGKNPPLSDIVRGDIDADRLDYLRRDAYYAGVAYGVVDTRILAEFRQFNKRIVLSEKGLRPAESILFARYLMYTIVYNHKTVRIASSMITRAVEYAILDKNIKPKDIYFLRDEELIQKLLESNKEARRLAESILWRRLFKLAYELSWEDAGRDLLRELLSMRGNRNQIMKLEREIAEEAGVNYEDVLVDIPEPPVLEEAEIKILYKGGIGDIRQLSPLANALTTAYRKAWKIGVYAPKEVRERVSKAAQRILQPLPPIK